jgi:hypothetical protein
VKALVQREDSLIKPESQNRISGFSTESVQNLSSNPARANEFFVARLQCQNNMKLVFRISEDGSEIELKHCASSRQALSRHENISCT